MSGQQDKLPRVCLITGASTALGSAVTVSYARQGTRVVLAGRQADKEKLEEVCTLQGLDGLTLLLDPAKPASAKPTPADAKPTPVSLPSFRPAAGTPVRQRRGARRGHARLQHCRP